MKYLSHLFLIWHLRRKRLRRCMIDVVFSSKVKTVINRLIILSISIECIQNIIYLNLQIQTHKFSELKTNIIVNKSLSILLWILVHVFWSFSSIIDECVRLLKRWNFKFDVVQYQMRTTYKWKKEDAVCWSSRL
jgi:hypothetical protein